MNTHCASYSSAWGVSWPGPGVGTVIWMLGARRNMPRTAAIIRAINTSPMNMPAKLASRHFQRRSWVSGSSAMAGHKRAATLRVSFPKP